MSQYQENQKLERVLSTVKQMIDELKAEIIELKSMIISNNTTKKAKGE